jgi:hypothetical protein
VHSTIPIISGRVGSRDHAGNQPHTPLRGWIQRWLTEMGRPRVGNVVGRASGDAGDYARRPPCQSAPFNNEPQLQLRKVVEEEEELTDFLVRL